MSTLLETKGQVANPLALSFEALQKLPGQIADVSKLIPGREGGGVRLSTVLAAAKPSKTATYITLETNDGDYSASVPLEAVADKGIIVYHLRNAPISKEKGGPVRFFIEDVDSCGIAEVDKCANVKHLGRLILGPKGRDTRPQTPRAHKELHEIEE